MEVLEKSLFPAGLEMSPRYCSVNTEPGTYPVGFVSRDLSIYARKATRLSSAGLKEYSPVTGSFKSCHVVKRQGAFIFIRQWGRK